MKRIFNYTIKLFFIFSINLFVSYPLFADQLKKFDISGNERLAKETIIIFTELSIGDEINQADINNSFKKLFDTDYFQNLNIKFLDGILSISVVENPIVEKININGIENKSIYSEIEKITKKTEKYPFIQSNFVEQKSQLLNIVRSLGFYFADVESLVEENQNNSINLTYNFNLGNRAKIKKIEFVGNKVFKNNKLRRIILSEENKPWKFVTRNKFINEERIKIDINLLTNFFKNKGYYNAKITSSFAKVIDENNFNLVFNIDSGIKYFFNDIKLNVSDDYTDKNFEKLDRLFIDLKNEIYSLNSIKNILNEIDLIALQKEFVFINAKYDEKIVDNNKIDINIYFDQLEKSFVDRINILGNFITEEKVIRNSLIVDEGDAYNKILFNKSINKIRSRGIFKNVNADIVDSNINENNKIINIKVEEKPTGEIFAGAGTGTSGSTISAGIKEKNYLGKGISLNTNLTLSDDEIKGIFSVYNPNFRNTDRSLNTTIESTSSDYLTTSGYKTTRTGLKFGTGFEQYQDLFINFGLSNYYEKLETSEKASDIKKKQEGDYFENLFTYSLTANKLDQDFQPTDGYRAMFSQTLPIYSDDNSIENTIKASKYHSINDNLILSAKFFFRAVNSLDDDVRVSKRVYIPGSRLRGFESGKIGPKDGAQYVGGNYGSAVNLNSSLPNFFTEFENLDFSFFLDAANLWQVDYDSSLDSDKIRSSTGISANWFTPIGPLSFSYAIPISEASGDKTESFRFQIGTSF